MRRILTVVISAAAAGLLSAASGIELKDANGVLSVRAVAADVVRIPLLDDLAD